MTATEKKAFVAKMARGRAAAKKRGGAPKKKGAKKRGASKKKGAKSSGSSSLASRVSKLESGQAVLRSDLNTVAGVVQGHHRFLTGIASVMRSRFGAKSVPALEGSRAKKKK